MFDPLHAWGVLREEIFEFIDYLLWQIRHWIHIIKDAGGIIQGFFRLFTGFQCIPHWTSGGSTWPLEKVEAAASFILRVTITSIVYILV